VFGQNDRILPAGLLPPSIRATASAPSSWRFVQKGKKRISEPQGSGKKALIPAIGGGLGFWLASFAISLTPIAAEYRAALSISYVPMLLQALLGGLILGFCVSYFLRRFFDKIPAKSPIPKSVLLSFIALVIVTMLIEVPAKSLTTTSDAWRYFLIGAAFNVLRVLALGVVIGYLYGRLNGCVRE
jgi:NhaP-type Na+/H+ or K+/H+ antiporter